MSTREEIASVIYEKFKANTYFLEGFFIEESITHLILQTYLEDYNPRDKQSTPPLALKNNVNTVKKHIY